MTMQQPKPATQASPLWVITGQREANRLNPQGQYVAGIIITFQTRSGVMGSVFVPDAQYTEQNVRNAISDRVASLEAVGKLTG